MLSIGFLTSLLLYTDMQSSFDPWETRAANEPEIAQFFNEHYHRAQLYSPFTDQLLPVFAKEHGYEYEAAFGIKESWAQWSELQPYILRDAQGNRLYMDFACDGARCSQWADDIGNPRVRAIKLERIRASVSKGYKGLWLDNVDFVKPSGEFAVANANGDFVRPIDPRTNAPMTNADWNRYYAEWLEMVRQAFPDVEIAHNSLWFAVRDEYVIRQHLAADYINMERGFLDYNRKPGGGAFGFDTFMAYIDWVHSLGRKIIFDTKGPQGTGNPITDKEFDFALASYWLAREPGDMLGIDDPARMAPDSFAREFNIDLGEPKAGFYKDGEIYRRKYACGSVSVDPANWAGVVDVCPAQPENVRIDPWFM